jgi:hypothetical protein
MTLELHVLAWSRMNETTTHHVGTPCPGLEQDRSSCSKPAHGVPTSYVVVSFILLQARTWSSNVIGHRLVHPAPIQDMEFQRHMSLSRSSCSKPGHGVPMSCVVVSVQISMKRTISSLVNSLIMNETTTYDVGTPCPGLEQDERDHDIILLQARTWSSNVMCRCLVHPAPCQDMEFQRHMSWSRS